LRRFDGFVTDVRKTLEAWGRERFDYLVNNAGNSQLIHFDKVTEADFDAVVNVHFKGVYFVTQKLLPLINDGGRIVNISSGLTRVSVLGSSPWRKRHCHLLERRTLGDFTGCRQIVKVNGIQERLYRIRVQVTINDGRWRAGVPIFGHSAPEMRTDPPAVLNRIKHLKSEAQLP
jgi:hypothetical protein